MARLHLIVRGDVQGVFYRVSAQEEAQRLGVMGWVRNRRDGAVEIVAEGEAASLERLRAWANEGPRGARVASVEEIRESATGEFRRFGIR